QSEHANARVFAAARNTHGIAHLLVPATANLAGDGQMRAADDALNHLLDEAEILQASRTAVSPNDFLDGAAEVDVDEFRPEDVRYERCRFPHGDRIRAEDLYADGSLVRAKAQLGHRRGILAADALGREKFSDDDVRTEPAAESTERRFGDAGHRREVQRDLGVDRKGKAFHSFKLRTARSPCNVSI